jgi:Flp pilus assembly protein TadD
MRTRLFRALLLATAITVASCGAARGSGDGDAGVGSDLEAGQALIERGAYAEAAAVFAALVEKSPEDAALHYYLGVAKANLGDDATAEAEYRKAIEVDGALLEARSNLGVLLLARGELEAARAELEACIELDPDDGDSHYNLGLVLEALGKDADAAQEYRIAADRTLDDPAPLMALAEIARRNGEPDDALAFYAQAEERAPGVPTVAIGKAQVLFDLERVDDAAAALTSVGKLEAADAAALTTAGMLLAKAGRDGDAIALYEAAIAKDGQFPRAHVLLANALARAKKFDEAAAEFERYLELAPDAPDAEAARKGLAACRKAAEPKQP